MTPTIPADAPVLVLVVAPDQAAYRVSGLTAKLLLAVLAHDAEISALGEGPRGELTLHFGPNSVQGRMMHLWEQTIPTDLLAAFTPAPTTPAAPAAAPRAQRRKAPTQTQPAATRGKRANRRAVLLVRIPRPGYQIRGTERAPWDR